MPNSAQGKTVHFAFCFPTGSVILAARLAFSVTCTYNFIVTRQPVSARNRAVCLVIPPSRAPLNHTEQLFTARERRANDEAKRVAYVGITRVKKLITVAVPAASL